VRAFFKHSAIPRGAPNLDWNAHKHAPVLPASVRLSCIAQGNLPERGYKKCHNLKQ
jgi:hypothetical protein